jgi:hypothetical protein
MRRPIRSSGSLGVSPTQQQKLAYIADKLGLPGIKGMQGSTVNLVDTIAIGTMAATRQTLNFFANSNGKSRNFSNFQNGMLGAGEAMVIERVNFFLVTMSATNLTLDATTITDIKPLSMLNVAEGSFTLPGGLKVGLMNITIANQKVVKDYSIFESDPNFNPQTSGIGIATHTTATATTLDGPVGYNGIVLESPPVLPPNQKFTVSLEVGPVGTAAANLGIMCVVGRFGSIFSAKTTL